MSTQIMKIRVLILEVLAITLTGCSSDYLRDDYQYPHKRTTTKIPEIKQVPIRKPAVPKKVVTPYKPVVKKYTISSSSRVEDNQKKIETAKTNIEAQKQKAIEQASVNVDPYASIPESGSVNATNNSVSATIDSVTSTATTTSSPAVKSLMVRARADLSIGKTQSAISKLERGLRIESQNPNIWHLLAKAQSDQSNHQQAISMAKKSIRYSNDEKLTAQNWMLIQKSGEQSDDAIAIKEALDYFKVNP